MPLRRSEKAEVDNALSSARDGNLTVRSAAMKAYHIYLSNLVHEPEAEESVMAEVGGILSAEFQYNLGQLAADVRLLRSNH